MDKKFKVLESERRRSGLTIDEISKKIGISNSAYFSKEKGTHDFTYTEMKKLAELFKKSLDYLFEEDKEYA